MDGMEARRSLPKRWGAVRRQRPVRSGSDRRQGPDERRDLGQLRAESLWL